MKFDSSNLPSRMLPYPVKEINVQPFRPRHLLKVSEAVMQQSLAPLIEAVSQVMDFDAYQLTDGDFYYVLTWLRFHSRNIPATAAWDCTGTIYERQDTGERVAYETIEQMIEQWDLAKGTEAQQHMVDPNTIQFAPFECGQHNNQPVTFADFECRYLDEDFVMPPEFDYPRVRHMVEYLEMLDDPTVARLAYPLRHIRKGNTLRERLDYVFDNDDMDTFDRAAAIAKQTEHGILQHIYKQCSACNVAHPFSMVVDASSFLP